MPVPILVRWLLGTAALLGAGVLAGCEVVALSVDAGTGQIVVRLEDDGHGRRDHYRLRVRQAGGPDRVLAVVPGARLELAVPAAAPVELTLLLPPGCATTSPNPRTVEPDADGTISASYTVRCV